jgi:hypothetical protein
LSVSLPGHFTRIEVGDPHLIPQAVWECLPPGQKVVLTEHNFSSQEWEPLDQRRFRIEPESYRTEFSFANIGALGLSRITNSQATRMTIGPPGVDVFAGASAPGQHAVNLTMLASFGGAGSS